jgi:hypothetical protein
MSERLPAELWHKIFQHACVDGGRTGRALSLVSRRLHDLSAGTRLQSVFVIDLERLKLLLRTLDRLPEHERRVRFLFIGTRHMEEAEMQKRKIMRSHVTQPPINGYYVNSLSSKMRDFDKQQDDVFQEWRTVYPMVLALTAPHVEALTIHIPQPQILKTMFPAGIRFPVLRDLSFDRMEEKDQFPCMPLLRRLHVFGRATKAIIDIVINMQGLQHVYFSGYGAVDLFAAAFDNTSARHSCVGGLISSKTLVITPYRPSAGRGSGRDYTTCAEDLSRKRDSFRQYCQNSRRFDTITVHSPSYDGYLLDYAVNDWRDVVENGGEGVWGMAVELPRRQLPTVVAGLGRVRGSRGANSDSRNLGPAQKTQG